MLNSKLQFWVFVLAVVLSFAVSCQRAPTRTIIECGGGNRFACPKGMFCNLKTGCGGFDSIGQCIRVPQNCPVEENNENAVCGCNDVSYSNTCHAYASAVSIAYKGECIKQIKKKRKKRKKYEFVDTSGKIDATGVEEAGEVIHDQFSPQDGFRANY